MTKAELRAFLRWIADHGAVQGNDAELAEQYAAFCAVSLSRARTIVAVAVTKGLIAKVEEQPDPAQVLASPHLEMADTCARCQVPWPCISVVRGFDLPPEHARRDVWEAMHEPWAKGRLEATLMGLIVDSGARQIAADGSSAIKWRLSTEAAEQAAAQGLRSLEGRTYKLPEAWRR